LIVGQSIFVILLQINQQCVEVVVGFIHAFLLLLNERFIAPINIRTYMIVTKSFLKYNQFTTVSQQLHIRMIMTLQKVTAVKTSTQYTKNTACIMHSRFYPNMLQQVIYHQQGVVVSSEATQAIRIVDVYGLRSGGAAFSIWCGFCMSGRKLFDSTA
jgi:hypothetical protein